MRTSLKCSVRAACLAIPTASASIGLVITAALLIQEASFSGLTEIFQIGLMVAAIGGLVAILPSLLYGAPLYAVLQEVGKASYASAFILGAFPAFVLVCVGVPRGEVAPFLVFGALIALLTHYFYANICTNSPSNKEVR